MDDARKSTTVLGIETSCDETAAAIVRLSGNDLDIFSDVIHAQTDAHAPFGGVVPEIAARAHAELTDQTVQRALDGAGLDVCELDGVAATSGPGLVGGVLVGMMTGKALAMAAGIPFVPINHLEGHALSARLGQACPFPYLLLLVSGGHCQLIDVRGLGDYRRLGTTIDDAAGEAFDKTAKGLCLNFPGGPALEKLAREGEAASIDLPRPLLDRPGLDMSFAGLKTAAARAIAAEPLTDRRKANIAAAFQQAVGDVLAEKTARALKHLEETSGAPYRRLVVAGGVAANQLIRGMLADVAKRFGADFIAPPLRHCTDNGAMIALAGAEHLRAGPLGTHSALFREDAGLAFSARPRWPLDERSALQNPAYGGGKRGAKA